MKKHSVTIRGRQSTLSVSRIKVDWINNGNHPLVYWGEEARELLKMNPSGKFIREGSNGRITQVIYSRPAIPGLGESGTRVTRPITFRQYQDLGRRITLIEKPGYTLMASS